VEKIISDVENFTSDHFFAPAKFWKTNRYNGQLLFDHPFGFQRVTQFLRYLQHRVGLGRGTVRIRFVSKTNLLHRFNHACF